MNITTLTRGLLSKYSSQILVSVAVSGVVATAVLSARGHQLAMRARYRTSPDRMTNFFNATKSRWKYYAPATVAAAITIASIIGGYRTSARKVAALTLAYSASERSYEALRKATSKVVSDEDQARALKEEYTKALVDKKPSKELIAPDVEGDHLCYDEYTGRYFHSTRPKLESAMVEVNRRVVAHDYCDLNTFYSEVGLDAVTAGEDLGWNSSKEPHLSLDTSMSPNGVPCLSVRYVPSPYPRYWDARL